MGSTVASDNTIDVDINNISVLPLETLEDSGSMYGESVLQHGITVSTKSTVYKAIVLPALLYSAEIYTIYRCTLENFPKCISDIYDKSCGSHGKITFQMLNS